MSSLHRLGRGLIWAIVAIPLALGGCVTYAANPYPAYGYYGAYPYGAYAPYAVGWWGWGAPVGGVFVGGPIHVGGFHGGPGGGWRR